MTLTQRRLAIVTMVAIASIIACHGDADDDDAKATAAVEAQVAVVGTQPFTETVDVIGTVTGRPGATASLAAPAAARVAQVLATVGQRVAIGQALVVLDQTTFASEARSAEAALASATQAADRTRRLADEGILPRKDAEQAAADLARARADAAQARRQEQLATLRAPIAGVVTRVTATIGATADPAQPMVEIVDPSALDVVLGVTAADAARVRPRATVTLSRGQNASGESLGQGTVADVGAAVDTATRTVPVRVALPSSGQPLRVGETVYARIAVRVRQGVTVVPLEALVPEGDGFKVFVVDTGGMAHERMVQVGARADSVAEIVEGVRAGERVVTAGAYGVADSAKVVPVKARGTASTTDARPARDDK